MADFYDISKQEKRDLRVICKATGLDFRAIAARPRVARELIADLKTPGTAVHAACGEQERS